MQNHRKLLGIVLATALALTLCAESQSADQASEMHAVVNIPAARVDVLLDGELYVSYPVAVGAAKYPTPVGEYRIGEVIWNPWWTPPESEWARDEPLTPPGPTNPMGRVKLMFAPLYFMHGTPDSTSVGYARSHGCIRMRNRDAIELGKTVMQWSDPQIDLNVDSLLERRSTKSIRLSRPVALSIIYDRFEVADTMMTLHPDPYYRGAPSLDDALLKLAAVATSIDRDRLKAFLARRAKEAITQPASTIEARR